MGENIKKRLTSEELYAFSDEMGMMISSGISSIQAITMMLDESEGGEEKELLSDMEKVVGETGSLSRAIEESEVFPDYFVEMAKMGETTGKMDSVLTNLAAHYSREMAISSAIRSAVTYPLMMVAMMLVIIIVLVTEIMPVFDRVFKQLGGTMDGLSAGFLAVGTFMKAHGVILLLILLAIVIYLIVLNKSNWGRARRNNLLYKSRRFKSIHSKIATSRFASAMAMTLSSGMDVMQALDVSGRIVDAPDFEEKVEKCKDSFAQSMDIGKAFSLSGIFGGLYGKMAILGAKTGNMENVLEKVATTYQEEADEEINDLIAVVEPTLVIILSVIVGIILLSVMLPLLNIMSGMI
ncbi:MAG: type II secretion system F family protein [Pseudobutyrivibrio sp.]|uniref:type II secretion system F family protein n=1 Tax=Pseudobutyrivibrio sp. TaxID=2014367 RepID=UPI001B251852|nr:type II secretion system F family protein [Pseudobutyrivibrio sp.]MBO6284071.1 type II secretion system F family protein [Pseudobutyrivibrio sp.]MBP3261647.1 type II secretion system F family protein [Pseudobutyrivibrio sp.]